MADDREWKSASYKTEEDHSKETDAVLEKINATTIPVLLRTTTKSFDDYISDILVVEKKARLGGDTMSTQKLATEIIKICRTRREYNKMLEHLEVLIKRRAQMKQVQSAMVSEATKALATDGDDKDPDMTPERRSEILQKLEIVTDGKIHLELEHARVVVELANIATREGRKKEASDSLAAIQVETITNMPRIEKLRILLSEIRLALDIEDYHRVQVMSRKLNHRALGKEDTKDIKLEYFRMIIQFYSYKKSPLHMARCWHEIYLTTQDEAAKKDALSRVLILAILAPHMSAKEIDDLGECVAFSPASQQTNRVAWLKELGENKLAAEALPTEHKLVKAFIAQEIIRESSADHVSELCVTHPELKDNASYQEEIRSRVSEHDLLVVAAHYTRIHLARLGELVGLTPEHVEGFLMKLVTSNTLYAKIDRVDGVVNFQKKKSPVEIQTQWNDSVNKSIDLIDYSCHLIAKERMIAAANEQLRKLAEKSK